MALGPSRLSLQFDRGATLELALWVDRLESFPFRLSVHVHKLLLLGFKVIMVKLDFIEAILGKDCLTDRLTT